MRFNFDGYSFKEWAKGNKRLILDGAKAVLSYYASTYITDEILLNLFLTVVGKWILDSLEFWISE
jgi:hypothetical protein